jgi:carboxyl-terminal processing protease
MKHIFSTIIAAGAASLALYAQFPSQQQFDASTKLRVAEAIIENYYVDTLNIDHIVESGIVSMLKELDPHSTYTTATETKALTEPLNGNFSGIGIQFQLVQDTVYVIQTIAGGPCEKVGIIPGDRIISVNDTLIVGKKIQNSDVTKNLRGPKGTVANLKVVRRAEPDTLHFRVIRDDIPLNTVDAAYMADATTGYIRISSFGAETEREFVDAFNELGKKGMQNLIIDLQDNGGGYLNAAVELAEKFLRPGSMIVYTDGLRQNAQYYTADFRAPMLDNRLVIMTNEYSASAAEIMSGAMQDNDRAVIVGRRTFGKGLVQRPFPFPDGSMIRLTTAHYYTPSGRSIQKPYEKGHSEEYGNDIQERYLRGEFTSVDSIKLDKSQAYTTIRNKRTVYGGGGIMPDKFVPIDTTGVNKYFRELRAKNVINQYVVDYVEKNRASLKKQYPDEDTFVSKFTVTQPMIDAFVATAENLGVERNDEQLADCRELVVANIAGLIGRDLFTPGTFYRIFNPINPVYAEALRLINNPEEYNKLLSGH